MRKKKPIRKRYLLNHPEKIFLLPIAKRVAADTMLSFDALGQVYDCLRQLKKEHINGSVVELGCWNGGCGAFMGWAGKKLKQERPIFLFDSFEGLPELTEQDREWAERDGLKVRGAGETRLQPIGYFVAQEERAKSIVQKMGGTSSTQIIKGWFQDTVPVWKERMGGIALLRLDGDAYESTKFGLDQLYDQVVPGGYVIVDDYHLEGCRRALYDYFYEHAVTPFIVNGGSADGGRAYWRKPSK